MVPAEIYVHIPFCVRKCAYCDFLSFPAEKDLQRRYVDALLCEIRQTAERSSGKTGRNAVSDGLPEIRSVFLGGGTPSLLPAEWTAEILRELRRQFVFAQDAEITIEANPGTVDAGRLRQYREAGINRISFGCQSFQEEELKLLGRIHTVQETYRSVQLAREAGFAGINLDLMSGLPGQTLPSWEDTLRQAATLRPEHISAYSLILEEGTPFYTQYGGAGRADGTSALPDEETERLMYERTGEILAEAGYRQYEISNYAKEGYACRHNLGYWTGVPYYGFGLGASGYLPYAWSGEIRPDETAEADAGYLRVRYRNTCDMAEYIDGTGKYDEIQWLDIKDLRAEFMILGLRLTEGVEDAEFAGRFGDTMDSVYGPVLSKYAKTGHLIRKDGRTYLSRNGISVSNVILADFLQP